MKHIASDIFTDNSDYVDAMIKIYEACSDNNFKDNILKNGGNVFFKNYLKLVNDNIFKTDIVVENAKFTPINLTNKSPNRLMLLFSGGKDSVASALAFRNKGWDVVLYFVDGINLGYSNEKQYAEKFALKYDFPLIYGTLEITGTQDFLENPTKNQLILAKAIEAGVQYGIYNYAYGGFASDTIEECSFDRNFSDCTECFSAFVEDMHQIFPQLKVHTFFNSETESLIYLANHEVDYLSCITPLRYREKLHKENEEKYDVKLPQHNCGSCWKCCLEYIVYCDLGVYEYNKAFYHHCLDVMRKKVPEERPYLKNIASIKDVYDCYVGKYESLNSEFFIDYDNISDIKVRLATLYDFDEIKRLWSKETDVLGRMFYSTVKDEILAGDMYVCTARYKQYSEEYERDITLSKIVGFCGLIRYAKTKKIEVDGLVVDKDYRGKHIAKKLLSKLLEYNIPVYAEAVSGAENNNFYKKVGRLINRRTSKSGKMELLDFEILKENL